MTTTTTTTASIIIIMMAPTATFAFEPVLCAAAISLLEHAAFACVKMRPNRACARAKIWLRRTPEPIVDGAINEAADPVLDTLNAFDHFLYSFLVNHHHRTETFLLVAVAAAGISSLFIFGIMCLIRRETMNG